MSNKIPTAEEFFKEKYGIADRISTNNATLLAIEFAKLHVESALEAVSKQVKLNDFAGEFLQEAASDAIDKDSIINAYPSHLIK